MPKTTYTQIKEIGEEQVKIMHFVDDWVHKKKTPVPRSKIFVGMKKIMNYDTIDYSLRILLKKGYIRRAYTVSNKTFFVQLRRV